MKNNKLARHYEAAKMYQHYYKPSLNPLRLIKSVLSVIITGHNPATRNMQRHR